MYEIAVAIVGPVVAGVVTVLGVWFREWRARRDEAHRRHMALVRATEEVGFIEAWSRTSEHVADPDAHARARVMLRADLERIYMLARPKLSAQSGPDQAVVGESMTIRRLLTTLLLIGSLRAWQAKVMRVLYYISVAWALVWAAAGSSVTVEAGLNALNIFAAAVVVALLGVAPAVLLGVGTRWLDRWLTRRSTHRMKASVGSSWYLGHG